MINKPSKTENLTINSKGIDYPITITEIEKNTIEIKCSLDKINYTNSINLSQECFFPNPFEDIISLFKKNKIEIKKDGNDELNMKLDINLIFKTLNSKRSPGNQNNKKIKDFYLSLNNNNIYIEVNKNNKTYIFKIGNNDLNKKKIKDIEDKIDSNNLVLKEQNNDFFLELNYKTTIVLRKDDVDYINVDNINWLNDFENNFDEKKAINNNKEENIAKVIKDFNSENSKRLNRMEKLIKEMKDKQKYQLDTFKSLKDNIKVMKNNADLMTFPKKRFPVQKENGVNISSYILTKKADFNLINNKLSQIFGTTDLNYELLYRSSKDGDLAKTFKKKCKKKNTLVIVQTETQNSFGGFTTVPWDDSDQNYEDEDAFCFSLNKKKIYELKKYCSAIGCDINSGPRFCWMFQINNRFMTKDPENDGGGMLFKEDISHYSGQREDFELNNGEEFFTVYEMEVFKISPRN